jgi:hypothetical protein
MCFVGVLLALGYRESAAQLRQPTPVQPQRVSFVTGASDTIALSYVCGNHFRVTHTGAVASDSLMVHWQTTVGDTGSVRLYRKLYGRTFTESLFETPTADSVRISGFGGSLIEANAGRGACTPSRDTTWITAASFAVAGSLIDTTGGLLVDPADNDTMWSRSLLLVGEQGFSRDTIAKVLATFGIRAVGATPFRGLTVRLDALRPTASRLLALVDSIDARPEIASVRVASYRKGGSKIRSGHTVDAGPSHAPSGYQETRSKAERPPTNP